MAAADYTSDRKLGLALGMSDGSLVGKWRRGKVKRIQSVQHQQQLAKILKTPPGYFQSPSAADRQEELEDRVDDLERFANKSMEILTARVLALEKLVLPKRRRA